MNLMDGKKAADARAVRDSATYKYARTLYGTALSRSKGDAPIGLLVGHILRVNPTLSATPPIGKDGRRGFAMASVAEAKELEIPHAKIDDALVCAFVYGSEINRTATSFYTTYKRLFTVPSSNYWKCVYLRNTLGSATFNQLWLNANPNVKRIANPVWDGTNWNIESKMVSDATDKAYTVLIEHIDRLNKAPAGWTLTSLKRLVLYDCEYVYALWRRYGNARPAGYGSMPVWDMQYRRDLVSRTV